MADDDEIMDEFMWEEFFKENDKRVDKYIELFERYLDHPNRDEIIAKEMGWDRTDKCINFFEEDYSDDLDDKAGEHWKINAGIEDQDEDSDAPNNFRESKLYKMAFNLAMKITNLVKTIPDSTDDHELISNFAVNGMSIAAKIAGASAFGLDRDSIGGNIATCKRALNFANKAITNLQDLKSKKLVGEEDYLGLIKDLVEVRNAVAIHILDLRDIFQRGIS